MGCCDRSTGSQAAAPSAPHGAAVTRAQVLFSLALAAVTQAQNFVYNELRKQQGYLNKPSCNKNTCSAIRQQVPLQHLAKSSQLAVRQQVAIGISQAALNQQLHLALKH